MFAARDRSLNLGRAHSFHELPPNSDLFLLTARHYVQVDAPATVAMLLRSLRLKPVMSRDAKRDGQAG